MIDLDGYTCPDNRGDIYSSGGTYNPDTGYGAGYDGDMEGSGVGGGKPDANLFLHDSEVQYD